jgi:hypothetical protein
VRQLGLLCGFDDALFAHLHTLHMLVLGTNTLLAATAGRAPGSAYVALCYISSICVFPLAVFRLIVVAALI